ncbi:MAG: hypothetical protein VYD19_04265, partial [Myxococcota bacterium]|nr:hypothetical protein [Myxococcota bacterium]
MSPAARAPLIWVTAAYLAQLFLAASLPTVADEAYYAAWGRSLALGYLDHPPLIAFWSAYGGRALNAVMTPLTLWLFMCTGKRLGIQKSDWFPALFSLTPLGLAAGVLVTPDIPLLFSSALLLWAWSTERGLLVGFAFAVGLSSKALILFYLPALLLTMRIRQSAIALLFALLIYSPQLYWSLHHEGYPWRFQFGRPMLGPHPLHFVFTQLLCIGPLLVPAALAAVMRSFSTFWRKHSICEVKKGGGPTWQISRLLLSA